MIVDIPPSMHHTAILLKASPKGEGLYPSPNETLIIDLMISLNQSIRQGHAEEVTDTVEKVLGRKPIEFKQFVEDNKSAWL